MEPTLVDPIFICDYPREVSLLAHRHREDLLLVERFEAVLAGIELANAFSELQDPVDQEMQFRSRPGSASAETMKPWCSTRITSERYKSVCRKRGPGNRYRPAGHVAHGQPGDPRRDSLSDPVSSQLSDERQLTTTRASSQPRSRQAYAPSLWSYGNASRYSGTVDHPLASAGYQLICRRAFHQEPAGRRII